MFFVPKKTPKKWQFIFIYDNYVNFIYIWDTFIGRPKLPQVPLKLLQVLSKLPHLKG